MADTVPEVVEDVCTKVKKPEVVESEEVATESPVKVKNGDAKESTEESEEVKDSLANGSVKENGVSDKEPEANGEEAKNGNGTAETNDVCGIKRKSEVGLEAGDDVESSEKKQKVEESAEPEVTASGDAESNA